MKYITLYRDGYRLTSVLLWAWRDMRWGITKFISPYDSICFNVTIDRTKDAAFTQIGGRGVTIIDSCTVIWPTMVEPRP